MNLPESRTDNHGFRNVGSCVCSCTRSYLTRCAEAKEYEFNGNGLMNIDRNKCCTRCHVSTPPYESDNLCWRSVYDAVRRRFVCLKCYYHWSSKSTYKPMWFNTWDDNINFNAYLRMNNISLEQQKKLKEHQLKKYKQEFEEYNFFSPYDGQCSFWNNYTNVVIPSCSKCHTTSDNVREIGPTLRLPKQSKKKEWKELTEYLKKLSSNECVLTFEYNPLKRYNNKNYKQKTNNYRTPEYFDNMEQQLRHNNPYIKQARNENR